jgi:uncharacterized protein YggT (Ycf19 family)
MKTLDPNDPESVEEFLTLTSFIQELIKIFTWITLVLLAFRGLMAFYGAKQSTWLEQLIQLITTPVVMPFRHLFIDTKAGEVPVFFSMLFALSAGVVLYLLVGLSGRFILWLNTQEKKPLIGSPKTQKQA